MTLDAGWKLEYIKELCDYARGKNVKILVWTWASCPLENPNDWIKQMHECGVGGCTRLISSNATDQIAMRWGREFAERFGAVPDGGHLPRLSRTGGLEPYLPQRDEL